MQPVFRAAFTLGVATWQPGCAHLTLHPQAFVCLSPSPGPQLCPQSSQCPALCPGWCPCCCHQSWWAVVGWSPRHPHPAEGQPEWKDRAPIPDLSDLYRGAPASSWFSFLSRLLVGGTGMTVGLQGTPRPCVKRGADHDILQEGLGRAASMLSPLLVSSSSAFVPTQPREVRTIRSLVLEMR